MLYIKQLNEPRSHVRLKQTVNAGPPSDCSLLTALIKDPPQITLLLQALNGLSIIIEFWGRLRARRDGFIIIIIYYSTQDDQPSNGPSLVAMARTSRAIDEGQGIIIR